MAIPEFNNQGLLPHAVPFDHDDDGAPVYSGHDCTAAETESRFVTHYPNSTTRAALYQHVRQLVRIVKGLGLECVLMIVSGAFVTDQENPEDVFVVLDVPGDDLDKLDGDLAYQVNSIFNSGEQHYGEDSELTIQTGIIRAYAPGHRKFSMGHSERLTQRHMASEPLEGREGGYLEIFGVRGGVEQS